MLALPRLNILLDAAGRTTAPVPGAVTAPQAHARCAIAMGRPRLFGRWTRLSLQSLRPEWAHYCSGVFQIPDFIFLLIF
jgi:hypothetical protein